MSLLRLPSISLRTLFIVAVILHVGVILALHNYWKPMYWENGGIALHVYEGHGFSGDFSMPNDLTASQAPGYPYVLYALWEIFGKDNTFGYVLLSLLQALAVSLAVFPMTWLARRWFDDQAGQFAGIITVFLPLFAWYATRIHHTAFVMAVHPWLLWAWLTLPEARTWSRALLAGLLTGVAGLFQPVLLFPFGVISGLLLLKAGAVRDGISIQRILAAGCLTLLVLTPWTLRNYEVFHRVILVKDSFGKEFWIGHNPNATGTAFTDGGKDLFSYCPPKSGALIGKVHEIELMDALQKEATDYIAAHPVAVVKLDARKLLWFWTFTPSRFVRSTGSGEALTFGWLQAAYWFAFLALMLVGLFRKKWPLEYLLVVLIFAVAYSATYVLTHVGQVRFRGEIEYLFLPAVASGLGFFCAVRQTKPS